MNCPLPYIDCRNDGANWHNYIAIHIGDTSAAPIRPTTKCTLNRPCRRFTNYYLQLISCDYYRTYRLKILIEIVNRIADIKAFCSEWSYRNVTSLPIAQEDCDIRYQFISFYCLIQLKKLPNLKDNDIASSC